MDAGWEAQSDAVVCWTVALRENFLAKGLKHTVPTRAAEGYRDDAQWTIWRCRGLMAHQWPDLDGERGSHWARSQARSNSD